METHCYSSFQCAVCIEFFAFHAKHLNHLYIAPRSTLSHSPPPDFMHSVVCVKAIESSLCTQRAFSLNSSTGACQPISFKKDQLFLTQGWSTAILFIFEPVHAYAYLHKCTHTHLHTETEKVSDGKKEINLNDLVTSILKIVKEQNSNIRNTLSLKKITIMVCI